MSGSGRRSGSKWDLKEDVSPEIHPGISRSNNSREFVSGRRGFQRDGHMNEESMLGLEGDGNYTRRMSLGPNGRRLQNRSRSPRRSRGRPYRSRSKSRSRSPAHNLRQEPDLNRRSNNKSGHSAPLCRDFAAGRCRKGDLCRFAHHGSPDHHSRRRFQNRTGDDWESRCRDDGALRHHSDTYSTGGGSMHICNDFLKGRCTRGALCKYHHHDSGSNEFGKGTIDVSHGDGDNEWRSKSGSSYSRRAHIRSEPLCKSFVAGNCRNGEHCKISHQREEHLCPERRLPDDRQPEQNFNGANEVWNDPNGTVKTSLRNVPDRTDFIDPGKSRAGEWSRDEVLNNELNYPTYMRGAVNNGNEWKINNISNSESKGTEKGLDDGKMLSPTVLFSPHMSLVSRKSDSLPFSQTSLPTVEQDIAQRAVAESHYVSGIMKPNMSNAYLKPNLSFRVDTAIDARNNGSSNVIVNIPADIPSAQGIHQIDGGFRAQPLSSIDAVGQSHLTAPLHPSGRENIQMPHHQTVLGTNLAMGQSQSTFPLQRAGEGLRMPQHQPVLDSNRTDGSYASSAGVSQAASGATLSQNSVLHEQLAQYSHLSATLAQLLEKRQQVPQLYAAIPQQTAIDGGSSLSNSSVTVPPVSAIASKPTQASEPIRQYDPMRDSMDTKVASTSKKLLPSAVGQRSSVLAASEVPSVTYNPTLFTTGDPRVGSSGDELQHKSADMNVQGAVVVSKEENGQATGKGLDDTQEVLDQGPTENIALDNGADDGKKAKDAKGIRQFKFALTEFVKELMKPTWKEGQISKEVYKTIVKKVVDKVIDTIQVAQIPQTKEKIDQYLSFSKPKLSKLVQAYVEKYQKT